MGAVCLMPDIVRPTFSSVSLSLSLSLLMSFMIPFLMSWSPVKNAGGACLTQDIVQPTLESSSGNHFASLTLHHVKLSFLFDCQQSSNSTNQINHCFSLSIHLKPNLHNMSIFSECESVLSFFTARLDTH